MLTFPVINKRHRKKPPLPMLRKPIENGIFVERVFVETGVTGMADWDFGIALDVTGNPPMNLVVLVNGEWLQPQGLGIDGRVLQLSYDTAEDLTGKQWGILVTPTGIGEAARIVTPQGGVIE